MPNFQHPDLNATIDKLASLKIATTETYLNSLAHTAIANTEGLDKIASERAASIRKDGTIEITGLAAAGLKIAGANPDALVADYRNYKAAMLNSFKQLCEIEPAK